MYYVRCPKPALDRKIAPQALLLVKKLGEEVMLNMTRIGLLIKEGAQ